MVVWREDTKRNAIEIAQQWGVSESHRQTGIPISTISWWCQQEGVDVVQGPITAAQKAGRMSAARRRQMIEENQEDATIQMVHILRLGLDKMVKRLKSDDDAKKKIAFNDLATAVTKIVPVLQLLSGQEEERQTRLAQVQIDLMMATLRSIIADPENGLDVSQRELLAERVPVHLELVAGDLDTETEEDAG